MKRCVISSLVILLRLSCVAQTYSLSSPDLKLQLNIQNLGQLQFSVSHETQLLLTNVTIGLAASDGSVMGRDAKIKAAKQTYTNERIKPDVRVKNAEILNEYNELVLSFRDNYEVIFRAYNDAFAYRFVSNKADSLTLLNEWLDVDVEGSTEGYFQKIEAKENFLNNYERPYLRQTFGQLAAPTLLQLPLLTYNRAGYRLLFAEADLYDYPGMYLRAEASGHLKGVWPAVVKATQMPPKPSFGWDRTTVPTERFEYIARTPGKRAYPWRVVAVAKQDKELLTNEIVYKLSKPHQLGDVSWIKPGKVAWDWWNDWNLTGVSFKAGINTATYKHYIDFAARYGLQYIIMDDGWYVLGDLTKPIAEVNIPEIVAYGRQKGVGILLWGSWKTLDDNLVPVMDTWQKWGVAGMKIDFMDRDDQYAVNFYERCAAEAAKRQLIVDFHGAYKPTGLHRAYPNVLNFEGVQGLEQNKWGGQHANPDMAVTIPFVRMFAGPLDYTPGAMLNAQRHEYNAVNSKPMSLGTRCQQLAMYVVYEAPLQMLSDSPSLYEKEPESMSFLSKVPTTWDTTHALDSQVGAYVALARRSGQAWFVGAMTNWQARNLTLDFSFLPTGTYQIEIWQDGPNASKNGTDYQKTTRRINAGDKLSVSLAPGGGWVAHLVPVK
jgi:alpha-glucosidase